MSAVNYLGMMAADSSSSMDNVKEQPPKSFIPTIKRLHFKVVQYMMEACIKLKLDSTTSASACTIYHRFFSRCQAEDYDPYLIGATAIYLATKVEEQFCKLRDIINVCYRILHKNESPLEIGKLYWDLRESTVNCELLVIRTLGYNPKASDLPHKYLVHYLKSLQSWIDKETWDSVPLCNTAWGFLRDSYHVDLCLRTKPQHLAIACIYFAMEVYCVTVPYNDVAKIPWWKVFSEDIKLVRIEAIISELIDMYDMETKVKPQAVTENSNKTATDSLNNTATPSK